MTNIKEQIINTAFFYIKEGEQGNFENFRNRAHVLLEKYGAKIERIIRPTSLVEGELDLPSEIHFASYPNMDAVQAFNQDPDFQALNQQFGMPQILDKMFGFVTKQSDLAFFREHGDAGKTYLTSLIWMEEGDEFATPFAEYQEKANSIYSEHGIHFERFLTPVMAANKVIDQPSEIQRFFFDGDRNLKEALADVRLDELLSKRNQSIKRIVQIAGKAL